MLKQPMTAAVLSSYGRLTLVTGTMALCFVPVFGYIGTRTRQFIPPLVGATGFTFLNFASLVSPTYGPWVPTSIPVFYLLNAIGWGQTQLPFTWSMLVPIFFISVVCCIREYVTQEVH
ncbi:MAG TPA: hypothetical protein VHS59_05735 [Bacillota bacterium]|nr:hypothetical protein [Bacillota bacterium]